MLAAIELIAVANGPKRAKGTGQGSLGLAAHKALRIEPVADQIGDVDQLELVAMGVIHQLGQPGHGSIGVLDLTNHASRIQAS